MKSIRNLLLLLPLLFCACQSSQKSTLRVNVGAEPQTLDPRKGRDLQVVTITRMFFDGLTRAGKDDKAELAVAERVSVSEDLKTYTFHLKDTHWSNGEPVTANDFAYAWKKVLDPKFMADNAFQLYVIKNAKKAKAGACDLNSVGIYALDRNTLLVELENPTPYFLELVAFPVFFPVNQRVDQADPRWAESGKNYVSNGPFVLKEWKHSDVMEVQKNSKYWDAKSVNLPEMQLVMVNEDTEFKMYEKKELDWAGSPLSVLPLDAIAALKKQKHLNSKPLLGTYFLRTNIERAPFNNSAVRRAFAAAINRKEIVEHVTQGNQMLATSFVPPVMGLQKEVYFSDGDVELAANLLKAEGIENIPEVTLLYAAGERNHLIAQTMQQQLRRALNVEIKLEGVERKVYFNRVSKQDFQLACCSWTADYNDPLTFLDIFKFKESGSNNTRWSDERYTELLDKAGVATDPEKRKEYLAQSEKVLMQAMPVIPIFHYTMLYVQNERVKDVVVSPMGTLDFKWAYLEKGSVR